MPEDARIVFPKILKSYMEKNHYNQSDIAKHLHVSKQLVSDWVNGKKFPGVEKMGMLAELFGVLMSDMYTAEPVMRESVYSFHLDPDEADLLVAYRNAEDPAKKYAMDILVRNPRKKEGQSAI